jgi:Domain of unknown function (DUF4381)
MAEPLPGLEALRPLHTGGSGALAEPLLWLALGAGLALAALIALLARRGVLRTWAVRREALAELAQARTLHPGEAVRSQALLLRRVAVTLKGDTAAGLAGEVWLDTLDGIFHTRFFSEGAGRCFGDALYGPAAPDAAALDAELTALTRRLKVPR